MDSLLRNRRSRRETVLSGGYMELRARPSWHMDEIPHEIAYPTNYMEHKAGQNLHEAENQEDLDDKYFYISLDAVGGIVERIEQIRNNSNMLRVFNDYFKKSAGTVDLSAALKSRFKKARDFVELNIKSSEVVDEDDQLLEVKRKMRYTKILDALREYFSVSGTGEFESVYVEQMSVLGELQNLKVEQEMKLESVKIWRNDSSIISASALKASPRIAAAMAAAALIPLRFMRNLSDSMLKDYRDDLKAEMKIINIMLDWTSVVGTHLDNIRILVKRLEDNRRSLFDYAEFVFKDEDPVRLGTEEMRKKMGEFMKSIEDLMQQADRCIKDIMRSRRVVLLEIIQLNK